MNFYFIHKCVSATVIYKLYSYEPIAQLVNMYNFGLWSTD